jgi:methylated-DNA-protein-cysteine methyltransferase-like protein
VQPKPLYARIYTMIRRIPKGRVSTYGAIGRLVGCDARQVGYAMAALPDETSVPWHRVLNVRGGIAIRTDSAITQRLRLEREGVKFTAREVADLSKHGWPEGAPRRIGSRRQPEPTAGRRSRAGPPRT